MCTRNGLGIIIIIITAEGYKSFSPASLCRYGCWYLYLFFSNYVSSTVRNVLMHSQVHLVSVPNKWYTHLYLQFTVTSLIICIFA